MISLLVDDSRAMRTVLRRIMTAAGFEVWEAANGQLAVNLLAGRDEVPDIALVDWNMPEMDGLQFVRSVRAGRRLRSMALMMCTTESEHSQVVRALAAGAHEYLIKPFTEDAVLAKLVLLGLIPPRPQAAGAVPAAKAA